MEKKKEFEKPELTIITFLEDDIICGSSLGIPCGEDDDDMYCTNI